MGIHSSGYNLLLRVFKLSHEQIKSGTCILENIRKHPDYLLILYKLSKEDMYSLCLKLHNEKFTHTESNLILQNKFDDDFIKKFTDK